MAVHPQCLWSLCSPTWSVTTKGCSQHCTFLITSYTVQDRYLFLDYSQRVYYNPVYLDKGHTTSLNLVNQRHTCFPKMSKIQSRCNPWYSKMHIFLSHFVSWPKQSGNIENTDRRSSVGRLWADKRRQMGVKVGEGEGERSWRLWRRIWLKANISLTARSQILLKGEITRVVSWEWRCITATQATGIISSRVEQKERLEVRGGEERAVSCDIMKYSILSNAGSDYWDAAAQRVIVCQ